MMLEEFLLFIISVLPVILIGIFVYRKDKQKEPKKILLKLFVGGMGSIFFALLITVILEVIFPIMTLDTKELNLLQLFFYVFFGIALVEEFSKWIIAYKISYYEKDFDELYDAIIYCVFVALGFACFENLLYVKDGGVSTALVRALTAVPGHACDGIIMGYYFGLSKISSLNDRLDLKRKNLILSIVVPTITHGIYDYCIFSERPILLLLFFVFIIAIYIYTIKKIKKISSINRKMKYQNNYCPNCGYKVESNYCPICGRKNE